MVLATTEGEIEGKCFVGRRRTAWIDDVRRWTGDDMNMARTDAIERRYDCSSRMSTGRSTVDLRHTGTPARFQGRWGKKNMEGTFTIF